MVVHSSSLSGSVAGHGLAGLGVVLDGARVEVALAAERVPAIVDGGDEVLEADAPLGVALELVQQKVHVLPRQLKPYPPLQHLPSFVSGDVAVTEWQRERIGCENTETKTKSAVFWLCTV